MTIDWNAAEAFNELHDQVQPVMHGVLITLDDKMLNNN